MSAQIPKASYDRAFGKISDIKVFEKTANGALSVIPRCPPELFAYLELDKGIGYFSHYSSIIQKIKVFGKMASERDGRVAVALIDKRIIIGYAASWYPRPSERWNKLGQLMYEMAALEVSRNYRHMRIAGRICDLLLDDDFFEDKIAYMCGYSWHWDLDGTRLSMTDYRRIIMKLLRGHGFKECYTNEPNIALREENFLMARIGSRVSEEDRRRFRDLRFGIVRSA